MLFFLFFQPNWPFTEYSQFVPHVAQPNLNYLAPEHALTNSQSTASDMFSLGMVIYALYNEGKPVNNYNDDWNYYKKKISEVKAGLT